MAAEAGERFAGVLTSIVIAAGGTGGHLMPAFAVADSIRSLDPSARVAFIGTARASERDILARAGERSYVTAVRPMTRDLRGATAPLALVRAVRQARGVLRSEGANAVVGMGGYPSVPAIIAARRARIPSVLHEQNAFAGLANEIAARFTPNVAVSFPEAVAAFKGHETRLVGVPLRPALASFDRDELRAEAYRFFDLDPSRATVLVFGGSLGARRLNDAAQGLAIRWAGRDDLQLLVIGGSNDPELPARLAAGGMRAVCVMFVEPMERAYAVADLAICRAGASTVAELAATSTPSILVPLPVARRSEQHANARSLARSGAAVVVEDTDADAVHLGAVADEILADTPRRAGMAAAAHAAARTDAAHALALWALELARS